MSKTKCKHMGTTPSPSPLSGPWESSLMPSLLLSFPHPIHHHIPSVHCTEVSQTRLPPAQLHPCWCAAGCPPGLQACAAPFGLPSSCRPCPLHPACLALPHPVYLIQTVLAQGPPSLTSQVRSGFQLFLYSSLIFFHNSYFGF